MFDWVDKHTVVRLLLKRDSLRYTPQSFSFVNDAYKQLFADIPRNPSDISLKKRYLEYIFK